MSKDYCTWFPESWFGIYIGDCCKQHDEGCSTKKLYHCLKNKTGIVGTLIVTGGGALGCIFRYGKG